MLFGMSLMGDFFAAVWLDNLERGISQVAQIPADLEQLAVIGRIEEFETDGARERAPFHVLGGAIAKCAVLFVKTAFLYAVPFVFQGLLYRFEALCRV